MPGFVIPQPSGYQIPPSGIADPMQLATAALKAGFPLSQVPTAVAVALAESGGKLDATNRNTNGTTDHGAWQINDVNIKTVGFSPTQLETNLQDNADAAYKVWKAAGNKWTPWSTFTSGAFQKFLGAGKKGLSASQSAGSFGAPATTIGNAASSVADTITGIPGAIGGVWKSIVGDAKYAAVLVGALLVGALLMFHGVSGGHSGAKIVPVPV